ncbi:hypothetical protein [Aeromonas hydrophila]|uniref:hypothetical protein n=1 Tax=Aeromonas hydrophila TaxID=644 RepID=UPI002B05B61E|nr:hypothetical protein [Aeromonas hydrophila]
MFRPPDQVNAAARPRINATLQRPLGDMAIVQQRASGSDLAPPGRPQACRYPPDRGRHRLVVGALELLQHCCELTPSITRPQGQAAGNRRRTSSPHTKGWPRNQSNQFFLQKFLDPHNQ